MIWSLKCFIIELFENMIIGYLFPINLFMENKWSFLQGHSLIQID